MKYLSICSGIEAATVAWHQLGWQPVAFSEIEPFPSAVLAHHYPHVPNVGDMTKYKDWNYERGSIDLLVGGTPCQAFSVAGLRRGLEDARGNLTLTFVAMADHFDPPWIVWENVPGVLSSKDNAFGCFLAGLCGASDPLIPNGKWASAGVVSGPKRTVSWRILDAQYFGVAQRRRRIFVCAVRGAGNWRAAATLFPVGESVFGDTAPSREKREDATTAAGICASDGGELAPTVTSKWQKLSGGPAGSISELGNSVMIPAYAIAGNIIGRQPENGGNGEGFSEEISYTLTKTDQHGVAQPIAFNARQDPDSWVERTGPLDTDGSTQAVAISDPVPPLMARSSRGGAQTLSPGHQTDGHMLAQGMAVRRLTPVECERLQGFPDNYTNIPWRKADESPDGPRYKALGNSMAVPVMNWIGRRIAYVDEKFS